MSGVHRYCLEVEGGTVGPVAGAEVSGGCGDAWRLSADVLEMVAVGLGDGSGDDEAHVISGGLLLRPDRTGASLCRG